MKLKKSLIEMFTRNISIILIGAFLIIMILFIAIYQITAISIHHQVIEVVAFLNEYFIHDAEQKMKDLEDLYSNELESALLPLS